jgi:CRISPR type I-E-associated protein CasB/Cse2
MNGQANAVERQSVGSLVSAIAAFLEGGGAISTGDVAALRRMDPRHPDAAFFKIEGLVLDDHLPGDADARADLETRWAAVVAGLAQLGSLHVPGDRLGDVLADVQYSELRFARLVRADVDRLVDELPSLARLLSAKGAQVDWTGAAQLILSAGGRNEESIRRHIARDYFRSMARKASLRVEARARED